MSYNWIYFHRFYWENGCKPDNASGYADDYHCQENTAASRTALNCRQWSSVNDSFDFELQSRLHECEATPQGIGLSFLRVVGTHLCAGFFVARKPVTTEWPAGWDMTVRRPLFDRSEHSNAAVKLRGRDRKTTFRQTGENRRESVSTTVTSIGFWYPKSKSTA